jgi:acyl-CoA hydrolase
MHSKNKHDSTNRMTELVLPNDTNTFGNLMGGRLMYWMDIAAAYCAARHCNAPVVTASVDNISFKNPIKLGHYVHIEARVTRAFTTSMEIYMKVWGEDTLHQFKYESNEAYFTFVAFDGALRRRQLRLILGGKMKPDEATELKALFNQ